MSGKIPVRIVTDGDGTMHRVGVDFGANHNFEVVTAADQRPGGHVAMTQAVATALGIGGAPAFPLDGLAVPSFAYATMALTTGYGGSVARFRATAGPDNTVDVAADTSGRISASSSVTWVSGGGTAFNGTLGTWITTAAASGGCESGNAFVVRLNDQIGTNHWQQATASLQPYAVQAGVLCVNAAASRACFRNPSGDSVRGLVQTSNPAYGAGAWTLVTAQAPIVTTFASIAVGVTSTSAAFLMGFRARAATVVRGRAVFNITNGAFDGQYDYTPANVPKVYSWNARSAATQQLHENASTDFSTAGACTNGTWPGVISSGVSAVADAALPCDTFALIGYNSQANAAEIATLRSRLVTEYGAS